MSTLPPEYTARPGAGPHDNGPAFHAWLEELDAVEPKTAEPPAERERMEVFSPPKPKARTLHHVTIRVPIMACHIDHARAQAIHMARDGFGSRTLFEVLEVEGPDA